LANTVDRSPMRVLAVIALYKVAKLLVKEKRRVLLLDNLSSQVHGAVPNLPSLALFKCEEVEVFRDDVCKADDWGSALADVCYVVHLAAETGTAQSMYEISRYTDTYVGGTAAMLDYLANHKLMWRKSSLHCRGLCMAKAYICALIAARSFHRCVLQRCFVPRDVSFQEMFRSKRWQPECPACGSFTRLPMHSEEIDP
jgi:dTDP-L-rhamnose 4-epimerase